MRRFLRPNHSNRIPRRHVTVATASVPVPHYRNPKMCVHRLMLGEAAYFRFGAGEPDRSDQCGFTNRNAWWNWLMAKTGPKHSVWVWGHNIGSQLSTLRLWELLEIGELSLVRNGKPLKPTSALAETVASGGGVLVDSDPPTVIKCYTPSNGSIVFLDVMNWLPTSMDELAKEIGREQRAMPGELATDQEWIDLCRGDADILQRCVLSLLRFVQEHDLGNFRWTAAAQAMALYRHRCMDVPICTDGDAEVKRLERQSYYGGRCEVFFAGAVLREGLAGVHGMVGGLRHSPLLFHGPVHHLDLTGAYPAAMRDGVYPTRYLCSETNPKPGDVASRMKAQCCCAAVRLNAGNDPWPIRRGDEVWWVNGRFDTVLCGPELQRAITNGDVEYVYSVQWYVADRPFRSFVDEIGKLRHRYNEIGNHLLSRLSKLVANSLHGKFAQRKHTWSLLPQVLAPKMWGQFVMCNRETGGIHRYRCVAGHVQREEESGEKEDNFPLIAAYCTAYHRENMRRLKHLAGYRQVLYEDADSLHVTQRGMDALNAAGEVQEQVLGKLKVVRVADKAVYFGPKNYALDDHVVNCGLHKKSLRDAMGVWHHTNAVGLQSTLNGQPPEGAVTIDESMRDPIHPIRGRVDRDGWVYPLRIDECSSAKN